MCHCRTSGRHSPMPLGAQQKPQSLPRSLPPPPAGQLPCSRPAHRLSCCAQELIINFWPLPTLLPSDVPVPIAKFPLPWFPLPLCKSKQRIPAFSFYSLSISFIFIRSLQALKERPEGCTFPRKCPVAPVLSPLLPPSSHGIFAFLPQEGSDGSGLPLTSSHCLSLL